MRRLIPWGIPILVLAGAVAAFVWMRLATWPTRPTASGVGQDDPAALRLYFPSVVDLAVGESRLVFGFTDATGRLLTDGDVTEVRVVVIDVSGPEPTAVHTVPARFLCSGWREVSTASWYETLHPLAEGFFTATVPFSRAGRWGLDFVVRRPGRQPFTVHLRPNVLSEGLTPPVGAPAPPSQHRTLMEVGDDLTQLDSEPRLNDVALHRLSIAEAIQSGRPVVVLFASPGLDASRLSLPITEILASLQPKYGDEVAFIHVEVYDLDQYRQALLEGTERGMSSRPKLSATAEQWGIQNPPWLFFIDREGRIVATFFGLVARSEVEDTLRRLLAPGT